MTENLPATVSLQEYCDQISKQEQQCIKVLEQDRANKCNYEQGYINQIVFGCATCNVEAGICLACYLNCHLDHKTFEIGFKTKFRCDCGNNLFNDHVCSINPEKESTNPENKYNHNFFNRFCVCDQEPKDYMIACNLCRDWFHLHHVGYEHNDPEEESFSKILEEYEFFCPKCLHSNLKFLQCYPNLQVKPWTTTDKLTKSQPKEAANPEENKQTAEGPAQINSKETDLIDTQAESVLKKRKENSECHFKINSAESPISSVPEDEGRLINPNWRDEVCVCNDCNAMYRKDGVLEFITDQDQFYPNEDDELVEDGEIPLEEENVENQQATQVNQTVEGGANGFDGLAMKEFGKLDFMTQHRVANGCKTFSDKFKDWVLAEYGDKEGAVVSKEDVERFLATLPKMK